MKILLVEDSPQLNKALSTLLRRNSYVVDSALDGEEALLFLRDYEYDLIVLDIMLPKVDGLEVLRRARFNKITTPVILLTAKSSVEDKILGLDLGADDYLPKPFNTEELLARIRALGRRSNKYEDKSDISFGDLSINENNSTVSCGDKSTVLSKKELQILLLLVNAKGNIVSADKISEKAWDEESYSTSENVWVFISFLRKKLEFIDSKTKIKSLRYQGYYLEMKNA
jgi:DNA-binding response OmpR family regulator